MDRAHRGDGAAALAAARQERPDAVVLDVMLPDMSGLEVLGALREQHPELPVLLLTAKDAVEDRIAGLSAGGDDYVTKPVLPGEVVLRLRGLLRRTGIGAADNGAQIVVGDLMLDEHSHEVTRAGEAITLTSTEFELLRFRCATQSGCCPRRRSWTGCGATTSAAAQHRRALYLPICVRRSTAVAHR